MDELTEDSRQELNWGADFEMSQANPSWLG